MSGETPQHWRFRHTINAALQVESATAQQKNGADNILPVLIRKSKTFVPIFYYLIHKPGLSGCLLVKKKSLVTLVCVSKFPFPLCGFSAYRVGHRLGETNSALPWKSGKWVREVVFLPFLSILARMVPLVQLLEPLARNMGIDLSG
ncbi:MAG: hypothetical protein LBV29_06030 [Azoarcus sp.]|jgi:hypothetical protein|nr:hypothetical protein [Azoarcus sp.]